MIRRVGCSLLAVALGLSASASAAPYQHGAAGGGAHVAVGYFGIDVRDVSDDQLSVLKLRDARGAEIIRVDHDGPAGKMGLREHDVVTQMNGSAVDNEESIRRMLRETPPGRTVALVISRDGQQIALTAQMADRNEVERRAWEEHLAMATAGPQPPTAGDLAANAPTPSAPLATSVPASRSTYSKVIDTLLMTPSYTGVTLEKIGPQLAQFFGAPRGSGLLVKSVDNNSPAAMAGMKAGDVVVRADAKALVSTTDWTKVIRVAKGKPVAVVILRDHQEKTVNLLPDAKKHS